MRGATVVVRTFGGKPAIGRVWRATDDWVEVCSEENYQSLIRGEGGLWPVGIPREDVFQYEPVLSAALLKNWQYEPVLWDKLAPYRTEAHD